MRNSIAPPPFHTIYETGVRDRLFVHEDDGVLLANPHMDHATGVLRSRVFTSRSIDRSDPRLAVPCQRVRRSEARRPARCACLHHGFKRGVPRMELAHDVTELY